MDAAAKDRPERDPLRAHDARERILDASYHLFSHHGIHAVGIDRVIAEAGVAKATLYHHFPSKEALVIAFLERRGQRWTHGWLEAEADRRAARPQQRALAVFDALDAWFRRPDYEGCSFINTLLEIKDRDSPVHRETVRHLGVVRQILARYAEQAEVSRPEETGDQLHILLTGSIVSASGGELDAAQRARPLAAALLADTS